ncbi:MAG: type II toxin-antitoxin system RelE/ParE family toxin, partial [Acidobacteria bacterium]|nr:type II toxin-antitoxin system RelE/ParE family toxin [Acidobacteriota bacterium]
MLDCHGHLRRSAALHEAVSEIEQGLIDADLGGHVVKKKRVGLPGRVKRGGAGTIVATKLETRARAPS